MQQIAKNNRKKHCCLCSMTSESGGRSAGVGAKKGPFPGADGIAGGKAQTADGAARDRGEGRERAGIGRGKGQGKEGKSRRNAGGVRLTYTRCGRSFSWRKGKKRAVFGPKRPKWGIWVSADGGGRGAAALASAAKKSKKDEKVSWKEKIACRLPNIVMYISVLPKPRGKVHKFVKIGLDDFRALLHLKAGNGGCKMPL